MYKLCLAALLVFAVPSMAMAGGGNTKTKGSIKFINNTDLTVLCAVDPSDSLALSESLEQFKARGGRVLNGGEETVFKNLNAGNHKVVAAFASSSISPGSFGSRTLSVSNGNEREVRTTSILSTVSSN